MKGLVTEALFWKHLSDTLLDSQGIDKERFYRKIGPIKERWDLEITKSASLEILNFSQKRRQHLQQDFSEVIEGSKRR